MGEPVSGAPTTDKPVRREGPDLGGESSAGVDPTFDQPLPAQREVAVLARLRPSWVLFNTFSPLGYLLVAGGISGLYGLGTQLGLDVVDLVWDVADGVNWAALGWLRGIALGMVVFGVAGAVAMAANFLAAYWGFTLSRVRAGDRRYLRTRRGLFSIREVSRDEARLRGLSIGEPLFGRWLRMADTNVITTGLSVTDEAQPTAILPRGPRGVARRIAREVLGSPCPLDAPLRAHPRAALRRRLTWAFVIGAIPVAAVAAPAATGLVPRWVLAAALGVWPVAVAGAIIAYRALGHGLAGDYLVVRSGLGARVTSAVRRDAVSTVAVRQSLLQRRLGLCTVSAMTAAGVGVYEALDVDAREAVDFARRAAPGIVDEFVVTGAEEPVADLVK